MDCVSKSRMARNHRTFACRCNLGQICSYELRKPVNIDQISLSARLILGVG